MAIDLSFGNKLKPLIKFRNYNGDVVSPLDLPKLGARWTESRKFNLMQCFNAGYIDLIQMEAKYNISSAEFAEWLKQYEKTKTLKITRIRDN
jgi:Protein of unknown function (DUF1153)